MEHIKSKNLLDAIQKDRVEEVAARLAMGENVNASFMMNRTALHCAVAKTNVRIVETLLTATQPAPDLMKCDSNGNTVLHMVCSRNSPEVISILEAIINKTGTLKQELLEVKNKFARTALEECVISGNVEAATILVRAGADVSGAIKLAEEKQMKNILNVLTNGNKDDTSLSATAVMSQAAALTVSEEKEVLLKRLAELEEKEQGDLDAQIKDKKQQLEKLKTTFKNEKDKTRKEIENLEAKLVTMKAKLANLTTEEETKVKVLQTEINTLVHDVDKKKVKELKENDVGSCFECPVCLDICKPPAEIWQCHEGHIICDICLRNPDMSVCPQCRVPLEGNLSRNRVLEELARRTFPQSAEQSTRRQAAGNTGHIRHRGHPPVVTPANRPATAGNNRPPPAPRANHRQLDIDSDEEYNELYNNATSAWEQMEIIERLRRGVAAAQLNIDNAWVDIEDDNEEEEEVETVMLDRPPAYRRYDIFGPSPRGGQTRRRSPRSRRMRSPPHVVSHDRHDRVAGTGVSFSRGAGGLTERGRRHNRARGQWGRPSELRFLR